MQAHLGIVLSAWIWIALSGQAAAAEPWSRHTVDDTSRGADGVRLADVNGDERPDVVTGWEEGGLVRVYLNPGSTGAAEAWPRVTVGEVASPEDAVFADLDADGAVDVISCCEGSNRTVFIHWAPDDPGRYLDESAWTTEPIPATRGEQMWMFALPMQVDGKNGVDLVVGSKGTGATIGWLQSPEDPRDPAGWRFHRLYDAGWIMSLEAGDVDGDGDRDLIASDRKGETPGVLWLENPGADAVGRGEEWPVHRIGADGREVMFLDRADVNEDGRTEILCAVRPHEILMLKPKKEPRQPWEAQPIRFPEQVEGLETGVAKAVRAGDVDLDGRTDLIVTCGNAHGEKTGIFRLSERDSDEETAWEAHAVGGPEGLKYDLVELLDLDADGDLDALTCEERDLNAVVWYENPARSPQP